MKDIIHPWSHGRDPEDFGWVFCETGHSLNAYDISAAADREEALGIGVPASVLDQYETDWSDVAEQWAYGDGLCLWLQNNGWR